MKYISYGVAFTALLFFSCNTNKISISQTEANKQLQKLLDQKDYFRLDARLKLYAPNLDDSKRLYYKSFLDNAFNRNQDCIGDVDALLKNYPSAFPDSVKSTLTRLQSDSYFKTYQYAKAALSDSSLLMHYQKALTKDETDDIKNDLLMRNALKDVAPQQTIINNTTSVDWKKDKIGLIEIPIKSRAAVYDAIFDTRANISSITRTYAKKIGLRMLDVSYNEGSGATGIQFKTGMGIADSLYIGGILVRNAVFQVMPDSILYIAPIKFQLNIIIGFPVIEQLHEVQIYKDGKMVIPLKPAESDLHNFALNGLDPVIALKAGSDTLAFNFDSGAVTSDFYAAYFNRYKAIILKSAVKKTVQYGGAGGIKKKQVYILPASKLTLADKTVTVDSVNVLTEKITPNEHYYGNIGQDFTNKFKKVTYNFKSMYIKGD